MQSYAYNKKGGKFQKKASECVRLFFCPANLLKFPTDCWFLGFCPLETKKNWQTPGNFGNFLTVKWWSIQEFLKARYVSISSFGSQVPWHFVAVDAGWLPAWWFFAPRMKRNNSMPSIATRARQVGQPKWIAVVMGDGGVSPWAKGAHSHVATLGELWAQESRCQHYHSTSTILHLDSVAHI